MGGQFSTGNNSVWVAVERPTYMPGEVVNGRVLLNCSTPFQACKLVLKVEGYESTRWEESVSYSEWDEASKSHVTRHRTETRSGKRDFFKVKIPLASFAHQTVMPGQYEYGWSTVLPVGLPGSFDLSSTSHRYAGVKAKIVYKVKAECEVPGLLKPNLKHKARLWVQQPLLRPASEIIVQDTQSVKVCCCCNKGSASLTAQVERDSYLPGDLACVVLQVDNQSSVHFERVELKLKHCIQLSDGGCHHHHRDHKLVASAAPGVRAGVTQAGEGARRLCVQLPPDLQPTTLGHLVKCHYLLEIKCKAPSCISDLKVKVPVGVFPPATAVPVVYTQPPPGWHPAVVVPGVVVDIPSAPPCPPYQQTMVMDASKADGKGGPSCPPGQPYLPEPIKASYPPV